MSGENRQFVLPGKVDGYLATLNRRYQKEGESVLQEIVVNGVVSIHEEWDYDNWNGGTYGHALTLTLSEDLYLEIMNDKDDLQHRISKDINQLDNTQDEYITEVFIEMELVETDHWRESSGVLRPRIATSSIPSDALERLWGNGHHLRIFLSHKATCKQDATNLKQALSDYGIACFVAHEDIEPTKEWQKEIERALFSMDVLVAFLTEDFHESNWTDQEIGVAIGRSIPHITVRLGIDPYGLMGKGQALGGCTLGDPQGMAANIFGVLYGQMLDKSRLFEGALSAYASSGNWKQSEFYVTHLLAKFETLTASQVEHVMDAFRKNDKNKNSFAGMRSLKPLLEKWTGEKWQMTNNKLTRVNEVKPLEDDIPF